MSKLPALQFYPGDWKKDAGVQALSFEDRGIWFEILLLMHESEHRGKLLLNGKPMSEDALARVIGVDKHILTTTLSTLLTYGVASIDEENGALICRRMVRDESVRQEKIRAGKMGGNPVLLKQNPTTHLKQNGGSSVSASVSVSKEQTADAPVTVKIHPGSTPLTEPPSKTTNPKPPAAVGKSATFDVSAIADKLYYRHPKRQNRHLADLECVRILERCNSGGVLIDPNQPKCTDPHKVFAHIDGCHAAWCESNDWLKESGRFAPKLHEWLADAGFTRWFGRNQQQKKATANSIFPPGTPPPMTREELLAFWAEAELEPKQ